MSPRQRLSHIFAPSAGILAGLIISVLFGCSNNVNDPATPGITSADAFGSLAKDGFSSTSQVNLVSDIGSFGATRIDSSLQNAWGIALNPNGIVWIAANHTGVSVVYDSNGNALRAPVAIPSEGNPSGGGAPTGVVFNATAGFVIPSTGQVSKFIFSSEDGIISAWASGSAAINVADRSSSEAVYKGLAMASDGGQNFLYATNFKGGAVDVFDEHFQLVSTKPFNDPSIPSGFAPFNIQNIDGKLFVTYAKQKGPDNEDDQAGLGNGYVDIFSTGGMLLERFASRGMLNSPWGIAQVPDGGSDKLKDAILIGNFGDGKINVFDKHGSFRGQLSDGHHTLMIPGLWALVFQHSGMMMSSGGDGHRHDGREGDNDDHDHDGHDNGNGHPAPLPRLFFTAGPNDESDGLFGVLQVKR